MEFLLVLALIIALIYSKKFRNKAIIFLIVMLVAGFILTLFVEHFEATITIVLVGVILLFVVAGIAVYIEDKNDKRDIEIWLNTIPKNYTVEDINSFVKIFANKFNDNDSNPKFKFNIKDADLPFGRVCCFLSYFDRSPEAEEPIYYSPIRSLDKIELREYGTMITSAGIYVTQQTDKVDKDNVRKVETIELPLSGMFKISSASNEELTIRYANMEKITLKQQNTTIKLSVLQDFISKVIENGISLSMYKGAINYEESNTFDDDISINEIMEKVDNQFKVYNESKSMEKSMETVGFASSFDNISKQIIQDGNRMNAAQGHGFAAEKANTTIDKIMGKRAEIVGNDNAKNGPDRMVNGVVIQTKYCKTATDSIGAAFDNGQALYIEPNTGKMMAIEVPRDQYCDAVKIMEEKIKSHQVPGENNPDNAKKYVRKGHVTYQQSINIAKAGTFDSITCDLATGAVISATSASISTLIVFATQIWNGTEPKDALKNSLMVGFKAMGKGAVLYTVIAQLTRNKADYSLKFLNSLHKSIQSSSKNMANKISNSGLANTAFGQKVGLQSITNKKIIGGGVIAVVTYGPDICRALVGRISPQQLFKNASVTTAGMAGAKIGQIIIPIPIVGAVIGGAASGFIAKKVLDHFIEDDAVEMYEILREEFIDVVMVSGLNSEEFNEMVTIVFQNKKLDHILRDMYSFGDSRAYARENIVNSAVVSIYEKRKKITDDMMEKAFIDLTDDTAVTV